MNNLPVKPALEGAIDKEDNTLAEIPKAGSISRHADRARDPAALAELQLQVASYVEEISVELRTMARAAQLDSLAYFVDMARFEAASNRRACERRLAAEAGAGPDRVIDAG
jgi:hypothetical protein